MVERPHHHHRQAVGKMILQPQHLLSDLADTIHIERPQGGILGHRQIIRPHQTILLAGTDHQDAAIQAQLQGRVQDVELQVDVRLQRGPGIAVRERRDSLSSQVNDIVWPRLLQDEHRHGQLRELRRIQLQPTLQMDDVVHVTVDSARHLPVGVFQQVLSQVAANEPIDARDQRFHLVPPSKCPLPTWVTMSCIIPQQKGVDK